MRHGILKRANRDSIVAWASRPCGWQEPHDASRSPGRESGTASEWRWLAEQDPETPCAISPS
ncbi:MAG: hypothetical protein RLZZ127_2953 [Planctomycetota bacterium]|jgi:hypothetical protein